MTKRATLQQRAVRKVRLEDALADRLEKIMARHPGKLPNLTTAANFFLEAALEIVEQDLDRMTSRLSKAWERQAGGD